MKKIILSLATLTILSFIFLGVFGVFNASKGREVSFYHRLIKMDEKGVSHFNVWGLFSTTQGEYQTIVKDTMHFSCRVNYPLAPKFHVNGISAKDSSEEKYIAGELQRIINDSIAKHLIENNLDYDGTSMDVRRYANPDNLSLKKPKVFLSLFGHSSPEAGNYGMQESIQPGHHEPENDSLAKERVNRTGGILASNGIIVKEKRFSELQFPDTISANLALKNKSMLDAMRYVSANVTIVTERLKIETITVPNLLPIWLILLFFLFLFLVSLSVPKLLRPEVFSIDWSQIWDYLKSLFWILVYVILGFILLVFFLTFPWVFLIIGIISSLYVIWRIIYLIYKNADDIFFKIICVIVCLVLIVLFIIETILNLIKYILKKIVEFFRLAYNQWIVFTCWWCKRTPCQKTAMILFIYGFVVTIVLICHLIIGH